MNIIEAYIKFKGHLVILISGISGSGKTKLAKNISEIFKIRHVDMNEYCKPDYSEKVKLLQDIELINWDSDDVYDWNKFNGDMKELISSGVVVSGVAFPTDKIKFPVDFHIQVKLSKQNLYKKRQKYLDEHKKDCQEINRNIDKDIEYTVFNQLTYTYYLDVTNRSTINKFIYANDYVDMDNESYDIKVYDETFEYLISEIEKYLYSRQKN